MKTKTLKTGAKLVVKGKKPNKLQKKLIKIFSKCGKDTTITTF